jgi:hypothetical protein
MKKFNLKSFLNEKKLFLKNVAANKKVKMNAIANLTSARWRNATKNSCLDNLKSRPYMESFISAQYLDQNNFRDYSGGMLGI